MVPPAPAADDRADSAWLTQIRSILQLSAGGVLVGLEGAHPACAGPLVEQLLEAGTSVLICFSGRELLAAPEGSRVVLLHAARDAEILNMARPIVAERRLQVFVWLQHGDRRELSRRARDFLDWMQLTVEVPTFVPTYAIKALRRALDDGGSLLWEGLPLRELIPEVTVLRPNVADGNALAAMQKGPVVVHAARGKDEVTHFEALHRAAGNRWGIIWEEPDVVPEHADRVIAKPLDWEVASAWLGDAGVDEPRIEGARLELDPIAISRRAGRELPALAAAGDAAGGHAVQRGTETSPKALRVLFPARPVVLTLERDDQGQLVVRYQGTPLSLFHDALAIVEEPCSLPVTLEIRDFDSRGERWTVTAEHGGYVWARGTGCCYFSWDETEGAVEVVVVASSARGSSQSRWFFVEVTAALDDLEP